MKGQKFDKSILVNLLMSQKPRSAHIFRSVSQSTYITRSIMLGSYPLSHSHDHIFGAKVFPHDGAKPLFHTQVRAIGDAVLVQVVASSRHVRDLMHGPRFHQTSHNKFMKDVLYVYP